VCPSDATVFVDATLDDLSDSLTGELAVFLRAAVTARLNMIISGGNGCGQDHPAARPGGASRFLGRIITIELSYELDCTSFPTPPGCVAWKSAKRNTEGQGALSMDYLVQLSQSPRRRPVIVGEVWAMKIVPMR